jgi:hypothetical protein
LEYVTGIFCDIAKASDCVNHELLLLKLQYYGVQGVLLQWFKSYLQHRRQRVEFSVLGPLLFNIYINNFPLEINTISEVILFADDTSILCTTKVYHNLKIKLDAIFSHMVSIEEVIKHCIHIIIIYFILGIFRDYTVFLNLKT